MANTKSAAVRQLLFDLGLAIGTFFRDVLIRLSKAARWLFQAALVLGLFIGVYLIIVNWDDLTAPAVELYTEATINCGKLEAERQADKECLQNTSCMMTRDELVESEERTFKYYLYCIE